MKKTDVISQGRMGREMGKRVGLSVSIVWDVQKTPWFSTPHESHSSVAHTRACFNHTLFREQAIICSAVTTAGSGLETVIEVDFASRHFTSVGFLQAEHKVLLSVLCFYNGIFHPSFATGLCRSEDEGKALSLLPICWCIGRYNFRAIESWHVQGLRRTLGQLAVQNVIYSGILEKMLNFRNKDFVLLLMLLFKLAISIY